MPKPQRGKRARATGSKPAPNSELIRSDVAPSARAVVDQGGRILIPAEIRRLLEISPGDAVELRMDRGALRIRSLHGVVHEAQERVGRWVAKGKSVVDELIEERRREADHD